MQVLNTATQTFQLTPSRRATPVSGSDIHFKRFQLTPSRRATCRNGGYPCTVYHFNSRPHGGRLKRGSLIVKGSDISTHALTEGDVALVDLDTTKATFQLTPSRRATQGHDRGQNEETISTHALTEGDQEIQSLH